MPLNMPHKPLERACEVAKAFLQDMRLLFAEKNSHQARRDRLTSDARPRQYCRPGERKLRLHDVKEMFLLMRDHPNEVERPLKSRLHPQTPLNALRSSRWSRGCSPITPGTAGRAAS